MPVSSVIPCVPQRWIVCALCSLALAIVAYKNYCIYMIAEIVYSATEQKRKPSSGCPFLFSDSSWERRKSPLDLPDFYLTPKAVDAANSAFFTGKIIMVVPAGVLSDLGYSRYVLSGGMSLVAVGLLILLTFARLGFILYVIQSFVEGVGEALIYPSVFTLISNWAPSSERNFFTALVVAGIFYGETLGHVFFDLTYLRFRSWSVGHFIIGIVGLLWLTLGLIFIYHSPDESPFIHQHESPSSIGGRERTSLLIELQRLHGIPWCRIVSSPPFISLVLAFCSMDCFAYMNVLGSFETYQKYVLRLPETFSDKSSIMVVVVVPASLIGGLFSDWVKTHNIIPKTVVKRGITFISVFLSSVLQVVSTSVGCNIILFWVLSITAVYVLGLVTPVVHSTPIDLSARDAGLLMGIMTGARVICSIFKAKINGILITDNYNSDQWRHTFIFYSVLSLTMVIPFLFFGSGDAQHWRRLRLIATYADNNSYAEPESSEEEISLQVIPPPEENTPPKTSFWRKFV